MRLSVLALSLFAATTVQGAPAEDHWGAPASADYKRAAELVAAGKYAEALPILIHHAEKSPGDADVFNLLGFSYRKTGDLAQASSNYQRALRLSPNHLGALEYQGELFLMLGDLAAAEKNLTRLTSLCEAGCAERDQLATAIAAAKAAKD